MAQQGTAVWMDGALVDPRAASISVFDHGFTVGDGVFVRFPSVGCHVASASPERFLRRDGDLVASSPIKGTAADASRFLPKDRAEIVRS